MATVRNGVTFEISPSDGRVTPRAISDAIRHALEAFSASGVKPDDWEILKIRMASPLTFVAFNEPSLNFAKMVVKKVKPLMERGTPGRGFAPEHIASILNAERLLSNGAARVKVTVPSVGSITITQSLINRARDFAPVQPTVPAHLESGDLEGTLVQVTAKGGNRSFKIEDRLSHRSVECRIDDPKLLSEAKDALEHRVLVVGQIRYNQAGEPTSIAARQIQRRSEKTLAYKNWKAVNITGGQDAAIFVRRLRDG